MTVNNILIVKYIGSFAPYYYLGITRNGAISGEEGGPQRGDRILFYDESTDLVNKEILSCEELFTQDSWGGEPVVLLDGEEKLRVAKIFYEKLMNEEVGYE